MELLNILHCIAGFAYSLIGMVRVVDLRQPVRLHSVRFQEFRQETDRNCLLLHTAFQAVQFEIPVQW